MLASALGRTRAVRLYGSQVLSNHQRTIPRVEPHAGDVFFFELDPAGLGYHTSGLFHVGLALGIRNLRNENHMLSMDAEQITWGLVLRHQRWNVTRETPWTVFGLRLALGMVFLALSVRRRIENATFRAAAQRPAALLPGYEADGSTGHVRAEEHAVAVSSTDSNSGVLAGAF